MIPSPTTIDDLVRRAQTGDHEAFHDLVIALQDEVRLFVAARTPTLDLVEEAVQGAFVTAWEELATYELRGTFLAWLKGIARNRLREELRQRARGGTANDELDNLVARFADQTEDESNKPGELVRLRACLERLPARARTLVERRYLAEVPLATLAQQFKQSVDALTSLLQRVRRGLRQCVEADQGAP